MELGNVVISKEVNESLSEHLGSHDYSKIAVVVDENTKRHCYPLISKQLPEHILIEIKSGEEYKNLETCSQIWQQLTDHHFDRKALLINLGGGVIGDMGGFCAATYKRGIRFINLPTTLLSQVDASVGGKLGIDFSNFKNHIGLFQSPQTVIIYDGFLNTLPSRELRSGFAEVIKHHLIFDGKGWAALTSKTFDQQPWRKLIAHSVAIKEKIVSEDPKEKGLRKILNYGHTIGHAVESYFLEIPGKRLLHGEAIAVGMMAEAYLSTKLSGLSASDAEEIYRYLISVYQPEAIDPKLIGSISELALQDKKNESSKISLSLLKNIGEAQFNVEVDANDIHHALSKYNELLKMHDDSITKKTSLEN